MIKNYFKIAWRNLGNNPLLGSLNIVGLAVGFAFVFLIMNYVWAEFSVNGLLKNADNQYIIQSNWKDKNQGVDFASYGPLAKELRVQYPHLVANYYRYDGITVALSLGDKNFRDGVQVGDSTLLDMFGFDLKYGDKKTAFNEPFTILLSEEKAIKYFGKADVVGKTLKLENFSGEKHDFRVKGILAATSKNSVNAGIDGKPNELYINEMNLDFFGRDMSWATPYVVNHIELQPNVKVSAVQDAILQILQKNVPEQSELMVPYLSSLKSFYLDYNGGLIRRLVIAMSGIGLFILLMAMVNFINLSISRSANRMKEIGMRKALGSQKSQMVGLFLAESYLNIIVALGFSMAIYFLAKPYFESIVNAALLPINELPGYVILIQFLLILVLGFLSGLYPAFVLSSMKAVETLKGKLPNVKANSIFRKSLVTFQFSLAMVVLVVAFVISQQIDLFLNKDLGFNKNRVVTVPVPRDWTPEGVNKMIGLRDQFANLADLESVSLSYEILNGNNGGNVPIFKFGSDSTNFVAALLLRSDENYFSVYEIPLKAGAFFKGKGQDLNAIVINETAALALGYENSNSAVGQKIRIIGNPTIFSIAGISEDFNFRSKQEQVAPIMILNVENSPLYRYMSFKLKNGNLGQRMSNLEDKWAELLPGAVFEYTFMDETLEGLYKSELQLKKASTLATCLAMVIVFLGIVGMVSISLQKRTREIGIRKVLGSTISQILSLFLKEFIFISILAAFISTPIAFYFVNKWLNTYAYSVELDAIPFVLAFAVISVLSMTIVGIQTFKSAIMNPVKSLKNE